MPAVAALILAVYGYALKLHFFCNDLPVILWLARHGWCDIWLEPEVGYFRPLTYTIYKLGLALPLVGSRVFLHALNLLWLFVDAVTHSLVLREVGSINVSAT